MRRILMSSLLALLVVAGGTAQGATEFHLTGQIQETPAPSPGCTGMAFTSTGSLDGTPTGAVSWAGGSCVDLLAQPGTATVRDGAFSLGGGLLVGTYQATGGPQLSGRVIVTGTFTVTGGSGAYEGATGGGSFVASVDPTTTIADIEMIGTLD